MKTPNEIYLEEELKRVRLERDFYKREAEANGLAVHMTTTGPELTMIASSPDLVPVCEIRAGMPTCGGYAVHAHAFAQNGDSLSDYRAMYRMDELAFNQVRQHDAINHILPRMHEVFLHRLAARIRQNARVA